MVQAAVDEVEVRSWFGAGCVGVVGGMVVCDLSLTLSHCLSFHRACMIPAWPR